MNSFMEQNLAEEHPKDIIREFADIRLQELALKNKLSHPNWFTHTMQKFGQWLMARGEKWRQNSETLRIPRKFHNLLGTQVHSLNSRQCHINYF